MDAPDAAKERVREALHAEAQAGHAAGEKPFQICPVHGAGIDLHGPLGIFPDGHFFFQRMKDAREKRLRQGCRGAAPHIDGGGFSPAGGKQSTPPTTICDGPPPPRGRTCVADIVDAHKLGSPPPRGRTCYALRCDFDFAAQGMGIALHGVLSSRVGGEVAVEAFSPAKGDMDVDAPAHQSICRMAMNASCGTSTLPTAFMRFLPSFCFSRSLRLRVMSPP